MFLLDAVKDTVAVETQDLDPPGLDAKPGRRIFLLEAWESRDERGGELGGRAVDFHTGPSSRESRRIPTSPCVTHPSRTTSPPGSRHVSPASLTCFLDCGAGLRSDVPGCVTLGKSLSLSVPQVPVSKRGYSWSEGLPGAGANESHLLWLCGLPLASYVPGHVTTSLAFDVSSKWG